MSSPITIPISPNRQSSNSPAWQPAPRVSRLCGPAPGAGLDYLRDDLFPITAMAPIPPDGQGVTLSNLLDGQVERAKADHSAVVIAFGEFFKDPGRDQTFGFAPELV